MTTFWNMVYFLLGLWFGYNFGQPIVQFIKMLLGKD